MWRLFGRAFLAMVVTGVFISCASAQPLQSSLQGRVFDPSGAVIIGAAITAIADGGTEVLSTVSDGAGQFVLSLPPGKYTVSISAKGFVDKSQELEIALDIAFQCAPDHPYVTEHPEWFRRRPDGAPTPAGRT